MCSEKEIILLVPLFRKLYVKIPSTMKLSLKNMFLRTDDHRNISLYIWFCIFLHKSFHDYVSVHVLIEHSSVCSERGRPRLAM